MLSRPILLMSSVLGLSLAGSAGFAWNGGPPNDPMHGPTSNDYGPDLTPTSQASLPSDSLNVSGEQRFLTYTATNFNHIDSKISACSYYQATGAAKCDFITGTITPLYTFEQWKKAVAIDKYAINGQKTDVAHFINKVDLNLTRDHHMISYGPYQTAGYVCNHKGPHPTVADPTALFPPKEEVDQLIGTIKKNIDLVACVAMEYSADVTYAGVVQTGHPYTRFLIFKPDPSSGELTLAPSVDLDGRKEKFVPGVCTACHGGKFTYEDTKIGNQGGFPISTLINGDLTAHFLPFDMANFAFSTKTTKEQREDEIFALNKKVYNVEKTRVTDDAKHFITASDGSKSITQLIDGWYSKSGGMASTEPEFWLDYIAEPWKVYHPDIYHDVIAHSCRTCHVAMDNRAFEITPTSAASNNLTCGNFLMPNSLVTFNRFWVSDQGSMVKGQGDNVISQPNTIAPLYGLTSCPKPQ